MNIQYHFFVYMLNMNIHIRLSYASISNKDIVYIYFMTLSHVYNSFVTNEFYIIRI